MSIRLTQVRISDSGPCSSMTTLPNRRLGSQTVFGIGAVHLGQRTGLLQGHRIEKALHPAHALLAGGVGQGDEPRFLEHNRIRIDRGGLKPVGADLDRDRLLARGSGIHGLQLEVGHHLLIRLGQFGYGSSNTPNTRSISATALHRAERRSDGRVSEASAPAASSS